MQLVFFHFYSTPSNYSNFSLIGRVFLLILVFFTSLLAEAKITKEYLFNWDNVENTFVLEGQSSPEITLFEGCYYLFKSMGAELIVTQNQPPYDLFTGTEIFQNSIEGDYQYILFRPNHKTPRNLIYKNAEFNSFGEIKILPFQKIGSFKMSTPQKNAKFGSAVEVDDQGNLLIGIPGLNDKQGGGIFLSNDSDNNFSASIIPLPENNLNLFGSSISMNANSSFFIAGSPNLSEFKGQIYYYDDKNSSPILLTSGVETGDLLGWSTSISNSLVAISTLGFTREDGGFVSLFERSHESTFSQVTQIYPSMKQFGNEFGYSIYLKDKTLLVGSPGEDGLYQENTGAAYLFSNADQPNSVGKKLIPSTRSSGDRFGHSVNLNNDLAIVSAPNGEGSITDSGIVYIFKFISADLQTEQIAEIIPPEFKTGQKFGQVVDSIGEFLFVLSPSSGDSGYIYIYQHSHGGKEWELANKISLSDYSFDSDYSSEVSVSVGHEYLAIGLPFESSNELHSGSIEIFHSPAWAVFNKPELPPFLDNFDQMVNILEEGALTLVYDFNASHPFFAEEMLSWGIESSNAPINSFDINNSSGIFRFSPDADLFGTFEFSLSVSISDQTLQQDFTISINPVSDSPRFLDANTILPNAIVSDSYSYLVEIYDPDGPEDFLTLNLSNGSSLPAGLEINSTTFAIEGIPSSEGNFTFDLILSDSSNNSVTKEYSLQVFPFSTPPSVKLNGSELTSPAEVTLFLNENFSLSDWQNEISNFEVINSGNEDLKISVLQSPQHGNLFTSQYLQDFDQSVKYFPHFNFFGEDLFTLKLIEDNNPAAKEFLLTFNLEIEPDNSGPLIISAPPDSQIEVGSYFNHQFQIFDEEGDPFQLTFVKLPSWLSFDGIRSIRGTPGANDLESLNQDGKFVATVSDQFNNKFSQFIDLNVIPENNAWPPEILQGDKLSKSITEDNGSLTISLLANSPQGSNLSWHFSQDPSHGNVSIAEQNSSHATFVYTPDSNFSGYDIFYISLYETFNPTLTDKIQVEVYVAPLPDPPIFDSKIFEGVILGKPFTLKVTGFDADLEDRLILKMLNFPTWLKLDQSLSSSRTWVFKGVPTEVEEFDIQLELSDGNTSVFQNYSLKVVDDVENLIFVNELPSMVEIEEDHSWEFDQVTVNAHEQIEVSWEILSSPENGVFTYENTQNGTITNLRYIPDNHFHGNDHFKIRATDGYSMVESEVNFAVTSVADPPRFLEFPEGNDGIIESSDEVFDFIISYEDGDGVDSTDLIITGLPQWVSYEVLATESTLNTRKLKFFGIPQVQDIGLHPVEVKLAGKFDGFQISSSFSLKVNFYNHPPTVFPIKLNFELFEDSSGQWTNFITAQDLETNPDDLKWSIAQAPQNGIASIDLKGTSLSYSPKKDFSGEDYFQIKVTDGGGINNSNFRHTYIPVTIKVKDIEDSPVFTSYPPSDSNISNQFTWSDEEDYLYQVSVYDADWNWQGYPIINLVSPLPSWAKWEVLGEGKALLSGSPKWYDEGNYTFSIVAQSGSDKITQEFKLQIIVRDFPPRIVNSLGQDVPEKIIVFILEDNHLGEVNRAVTDLKAYNPDKDLGDILSWRVFQHPTSGGDIPDEITSTNEGDYTLISDFSYIPPKNFFGLDSFTLVADEGDRSTEVVIEVHVKEVQDPPLFNTPGPLVFDAQKGTVFEKTIFANDPDKQKLVFRLLYPSGSNKWLSVQSTSSNINQSSITIGGQVPLSGGSGSYTLVASDPTGRFTILNIEVQAN